MHLSVQADAGRPVDTLCERRFESGEYELTDLEPTCAACMRRRQDPSRISNAMFGSDLGARLLELSLGSVRKRPEDQQADDAAAHAEPPRLRVISTEPEPDRHSGDGHRTPAPAASASIPKPDLPRPMGLDLSRFERLSPDSYRSPGGVTLTVIKRKGGGWDVSKVAFSGESTLEQLPDGRVRVSIGDLRFEYSGKFEARLRLD